MFKLLLIATLLFIPITGMSQNCHLEAIEFDRESFEIRNSIPAALSFDELIIQIQSLSNSKAIQLWIVAGWIYDNMEFDLHKFKIGGPVENFESIFQNKKGVCGEYSTLFSEFCTALGVRNHIIEGYAPEIIYNPIFKETNHAWNIVLIDDCWYHCDLQGFSGKLAANDEGDLFFIKNPDPNSFLTRDDYFLTKHVPADPMWQLKKQPQELSVLLSSSHEINEDLPDFSYRDSIQVYEGLSDIKKCIKYANNAHKYNPNNHNVMVINYYNSAIDLINKPNGDEAKLHEAKNLLIVAKSHLTDATMDVQVLKPEIDEVLEYLKKYVP